MVQATTEESNNQQILIKRQNVKLPVETLGSKAHASTPVAALLLTQVAALLLTQVAALLLTQVAALLLTQVGSTTSNTGGITGSIKLPFGGFP